MTPLKNEWTKPVNVLVGLGCIKVRDASPIFQEMRSPILPVLIASVCRESLTVGVRKPGLYKRGQAVSDSELDQAPTPGKDTTSRWILNHLNQIPFHTAEIIQEVEIDDHE
jgi:hypothetical protein